VDLPLHIDVGEARPGEREPAVESQALRDVPVFGRQEEFRRQRQPANHRRLRRVDGHAHHVFDAREVHSYVERDGPPVLVSGRIEHAADATSDEFRKLASIRSSLVSPFMPSTIVWYFAWR